MSSAVFPSHAVFAQAAKELVAKHSSSLPSSLDQHPLTSSLTNSGWIWMDHPKQRSFGYLRRSSTIVLPPAPSRPARPSSPFQDEVEEDEDPAAVSAAPAMPDELISVIYHIVYSPTYRAPQLLLQAHSRKTFSPLSLPLMISLNLVRPPSALSLLPSDATSIPLRDPSATVSILNVSTAAPDPLDPFSPPPEFPAFDDNDEADFPLLAQAEHPSTGEGVWALHPCHLQEALEEVVKASREEGLGGRGEEGESDGLIWMETWLMLVGTAVDLRLR